MAAVGIIGQILDGKYKIDRQLGKGGMGTVYLSTHIGTGRAVAVKVIAPDFMKRAEFVERFRREAKAAGRLRHPNVVDVTDFGFAKDEKGSDVAYLVMEYLDGCTLGEVLDEEKKLPVSFTIDIIEQVCSAVEEAHKQGIIHRDLKPDNIWLEPNLRGGYTVKVLDFGIAKLEETQLKEFADSIEIPFAGAANTGIIQDQATLTDGNAETITDKNNSTIISENATLALSEKSKTLVAENIEANTMIQSNESNSDLKSEAGTQIIQPLGTADSEEIISEDKTAIFLTDNTQENFEKDDNGTKIIADFDKPDDKGTKLITAVDRASQKSRISASTANLTRVGAVLGTPLYMSPEQCRGEILSPRSDIYSLAVIAYQMLSGNLPFTGDYRNVMEGHKTVEPPPIKSKNTPKKLKAIVMQSLSKDAADRPVSAESFASKMRANSEGIGSLLRRSLVIYSQNLPKFVQATMIVFSPLALLLLLKAVFTILLGFELIEKNRVNSSIVPVLNFTYFVASSVCSALIGGMMTWIVAQYLAFPLRPVSLRSAFQQVRKRAKSLTFTVIFTTIFTYLGFILCILPGLYLLAKFMLVTPSIMMEGITGKAAFRRSMELTKRSFKTVLAAALLTLALSLGLGALIGVFTTLANTTFVSTVNSSKMESEIEKMKKEGVKAQPEIEGQKSKKDKNIIIKNGQIVVDDKSKNVNDEKEKELNKKFEKFSAVTDALSQFILILLLVFLISFTSVLTALLYFKTRQAGGESMQELLGKLDTAELPQSKWQQRVRERLIKSGKLTGTTNSGNL